jgi:large subunit ribosomal protein L25
MAERPLIEARKRDETGKRVVSELRRHGVVPGVIYGMDGPTEMIAVPEERLREIIDSRSRMVDVKLGADAHPAIVKEIQYDHLGSDIYHVDFERINLSEIIRVKVPIETHGSAKGAKSGGLLDLVLKNVDVECMAGEIPNEIIVEVADLDIGQHLTVGQLAAPAGVKILDAAATIVVVVHAPRAEEEVAAAVAPAGEEMAEPEVITARKEKEEDEEAEEQEK